MRLFVMVTFLHCGSNVTGRKDGENKCLKESNQQFDKVHECREQPADNSSHSSTTYTLAIFTKEEDKAYEAEDNDVPRRDIGEQSNHQGKRLDEQAENFHRGEDDFHPCRNARHPKYVLPVVAIAIQIRHQKGEYRQHKRYGKIACDVGAPGEEGNQSQQITKKDKEKQGHDEWLEALILVLANHGAGHFITDKHEYWFNEVLNTAWSFAVIFAVTPGNC